MDYTTENRTCKPTHSDELCQNDEQYTEAERHTATSMVETGSSILCLGNYLEVLPSLGVEADALVSDPPFGNTSAGWDIAPVLERMWPVLHGSTRPNANIVLFCCGKFTIQLAYSNLDEYRYDLIWRKSKPVGFLNANLMPMRNHESILLFSQGDKKGATYNPQKVFNKRYVGKKSGGGVIGDSGNSVYRKVNKVARISDGFMHPSSVLPFRSVPNAGRLHNTQKPVALMEWLIESYTNPGDLIVDPFMGSGSTGVAIENLNMRLDMAGDRTTKRRRFIGIELNEEFFQKAVVRIRQVVERQQ